MLTTRAQRCSRCATPAAVIRDAVPYCRVHVVGLIQQLEGERAGLLAAIRRRAVLKSIAGYFLGNLSRLFWGAVAVAFVLELLHRYGILRL